MAKWRADEDWGAIVLRHTVKLPLVGMIIEKWSLRIKRASNEKIYIK